MRIVELTETEWEIYKEAQRNIDEMMEHLAALTKEERLRWYQKYQYCQPIGFEKEIGGTVYSVTAHFSEKPAESIESKTERILAQS